MTPTKVLFLDGVREEVVEPATGPRTALGSDPFEAADAAEEPFSERLEKLRPLQGPRPGLLRDASSPSASPPRVRRPKSLGPDATLKPRGWARTPRLAEVDFAEQSGLLRLLPESERRRLAALDHLVDGEAPYDRFGFSPGALRAAFPLFFALYRFYFRVKSEGHENIPAEGPAILAANHGGLLPFDGAMGIVDILLHTDPPRLARAIVDRWAGRLPWVNVFYARVGQVIGTRENFSDLLEDGQLVFVFPEGVEGIRKLVTQRYRLQRFHVGFVEQSLRAGAPIIPMAVLGSDDQAPILFDLKPVARRLGLPVLPITPTFPWFGPLGLLPYPVRYRIVYGEPLRFHERFGPEGAEDPRLIRYLANQVRRSVQSLVDRHR
ncbi:MAG TPA: glycerol acyltransferase [Deltaproteobacteria bacterium]|nr:glycerol acyltransferase [Deltaproteobacteria bacterium]